MKKIKPIFVSLALILFLAGCANSSINSVARQKTPLVTASFYPLYDFAASIIGDKSKVVSIIPAGAEPHDYEPSPKDLATIYESKLFIYNGADMDPWAEKIAPELTAKGIKVIELAQMVDLLEYAGDHSHKGEHDEDYEKHEEDEHDHGDFDPHFWLDPVIVQSLSQQIANALIEIDGENQNKYTANLAKFQVQLSKLDQDYQNGLAACQLKDTVASHAAFNYLAKRYGFNVLSVSGVSAQSEPSPAKLAEIAKFVKEKGINYIFFETLVSPKVAETIANEAGVKTLVFNPIEGLTPEQIKDNQSYLTIMQQNLESLRTALNCQ